MKTKFRNVLAIILAVVVFPGLWIANGLGMISLPGEVIGATIAIETLIGQFYFRKKSDGE